MKTILLSAFAVLALFSNGFSQQKASQKAVIKTPTVQCEVCADKVTFFLSHQEGVTSVSVDPRRRTTKVTWLTDRTTLENIKVAIANMGYDADDIEAEEYAFKRLPKDCRAHKAAVPKPAAEPSKNQPANYK